LSFALFLVLTFALLAVSTFPLLSLTIALFLFAALVFLSLALASLLFLAFLFVSLSVAIILRIRCGGRPDHEPCGKGNCGDVLHAASSSVPGSRNVPHALSPT
jgi:hypothetical protein